MEIWQCGNVVIWKSGSVEMWKSANVEIWIKSQNYALLHYELIRQDYGCEVEQHNIVTDTLFDCFR